MRFFVQEEQDPDIKEGKNEDVRTRTTDCYAEVEYKVDSKYIDAYIVGRNENTAFVVASFEHVFDSVKEQVEDKNEAALKAEFKAWPTFAVLLQNGVSDRYSEGALIQLEDPDCGETKWFVATVIGNIDPDKEEALIKEKINAATELVIGKAADLLVEVSEHKPHYIRQGIWEGIKEGLGEFGQASLESWARNWASSE